MLLHFAHWLGSFCKAADFCFDFPRSRTQMRAVYGSFAASLETAQKTEIELMFGVSGVALPACWTNFRFAANSVPRFLRPFLEAGHDTIGPGDAFLDGDTWEVEFSPDASLLPRPRKAKWPIASLLPLIPHRLSQAFFGFLADAAHFLEDFGVQGPDGEIAEGEAGGLAFEAEESLVEFEEVAAG